MVDPCISNPAVDFGKIDYLNSIKIMDRAVESVRAGNFKNILLFFDYDPVYTVGRGKNEENFRGVEVIETDRGGDVTYHGPGQLVGYPVIDLRKSLDVRAFVKTVENILMKSIDQFGYRSYIGDEPGIWVDGKKVASVGMAIRNGISAHGFSINLSKEVLSGFTKIRACGLDPNLIGFIDANRDELISHLIVNFSGHFGQFKRITPEELLNKL